MELLQGLSICFLDLKIFVLNLSPPFGPSHLLSDASTISLKFQGTPMPALLVCIFPTLYFSIELITTQRSFYLLVCFT